MEKEIFSSYAPKYYEAGFSVIPVEGKRVRIDNWGSYNKKAADEKQMDRWITSKGSENIGLCLGEASGVCAIDYDYTGDGCMELEAAIRRILPQSPVGRFGSKGFGLFYKYTGLKSRRFRYGKLVILEVFSETGQVVLPPSIHPITKKPYQWVGSSILDHDVDDLPELTEEMLFSIERLINDFFKYKEKIGSSGGRHTAIVDYGFAVVEDSKTFEEFCDKLWEYDQNNFGSNSYFNDKEERGSRDPKKYCSYIAESIIKTLTKIKYDRGEEWSIGKKKDVSKIEISEDDSLSKIDKIDKVVGDKRTEFERFKEFYDHQFEFRTVKKCILSGTYYFKINGEYEPLLNSIGRIRSKAKDWHIHSSVEDHLLRCIHNTKPSLLIDIPNWDKRSRIDEMLKCVKVKNISHDVFVDMQKHWLSGIFRRLENPENQNMINLWEGAQGKGKDTFFINLLRGFGTYVKELNGDANLTDIFSDAASSLIVALPELEQFKKISGAAIKDLTTSPGKSFRSPYARESVYRKFRFSMYSTSNLSDYLTDSSGNRRFWIFEIDDIDWSYPKFKGVDSIQLISEMYHLFRSGYQATSESIKSVSDFVEENRTPEDISERIIELWGVRSALAMKKNQASYLLYDDAVPVIEGLQKIFGVSHRRILSILKQGGLIKRKGTYGERRYFASSQAQPDIAG